MQKSSSATGQTNLSIDPPATKPGLPKPPRRKRWRWVLRGLLLTIVICGVVIYGAGRWALNKTQDVPEFYARATAEPSQNTIAASRELESEVEELTTQVGQFGAWQATFTEDQINAWLIHQFPQEFTKLLPQGVSDPRVAIQDGKILAAARYQDRRIETVVSFQVAAQLTNEPNVLAIEISNLKAGSLPLPLNHFVDHISKRAARDAIQIRWDVSESGDPIALVTVPSEHPRYLRAPVIVESVTIIPGMVSLAGHTGPEAVLSYQPRTSVYQLASYRMHNDQPQSNASDRRTIPAP